MQITEEEFLQQVLQLARLYRWRTAHFRPARTAAGWRTAVAGDGKGWPDLVLVRDVVIFAELKVAGRKPTPEQSQWIEALRAAGAQVHLWTPADWPEIEGILTA